MESGAGTQVGPNMNLHVDGAVEELIRSSGRIVCGSSGRGFADVVDGAAVGVDGAAVGVGVDGAAVGVGVDGAAVGVDGKHGDYGTPKR
jgi:hypothetical protein